MAIRKMEIMSPPEKSRTSGKRDGLGGIGSKVGAVVGGIAGAKGGPAGMATGAAAGAGMGATLGNMIQPGSAGTTSYDRRIATQTQSPDQGRASQLRESLKALSQAPDEVKKEYAPNLMAAYLQTIQGKQLA